MSQPSFDFLSHDWGWANIRQDAFQLVAWGYQRMENDIRRHLEVDITGLIREGMRQKLDEELPPRFRFYSPHNEDPVDISGVFGNDRPRLDIMIECSGNLPRKHYTFEAKRCAQKGHKISKYAEGIHPFLEGRYAKSAQEAGMLGLVQSDSPQYWKTQLSIQVNKDASLHSESVLTDVDIIPDLPGTSFSHHRRKNGEMIVLYHVFLDCTPKALHVEV